MQRQANLIECCLSWEFQDNSCRKCIAYSLRQICYWKISKTHLVLLSKNIYKNVRNLKDRASFAWFCIIKIEWDNVELSPAERPWNWHGWQHITFKVVFFYSGHKFKASPVSKVGQSCAMHRKRIVNDTFTSKVPPVHCGVKDIHVPKHLWSSHLNSKECSSDTCPMMFSKHVCELIFTPCYLQAHVSKS